MGLLVNADAEPVHQFAAQPGGDAGDADRKQFDNDQPTQKPDLTEGPVVAEQGDGVEDEARDFMSGPIRVTRIGIAKPTSCLARWLSLP